jgi:hypothetical protein
MPSNIDLSLDGLYRAAVNGLQIGVAAVLIFWLVDIVFQLHLLSLWLTFVLGTSMGAAYISYQDTMKVFAFFRNCVNVQ